MEGDHLFDYKGAKSWCPFTFVDFEIDCDYSNLMRRFYESKESHMNSNIHDRFKDFKHNLECRFPPLIKIQPITLFLIFSISTWINYSIVSRLSLTKSFPDYWLYYFIGMLIIFWGVFSLASSREKHIQTFLYILPILDEQKHVEILGKSFGLMFHKKLNFLFFVTFASVGVFFHHFVFAALPTSLKIYNIFFIIIPSAGIAGMGLYLAISSCLFVKKFLSLNNLKLNPLDPAKTLGIRKIARLMLYYFILFTTELLFWALQYIILISQADSYSIIIPINEWPFKWAAAIFSVFIFFIVPGYLVYPYLVIKKTLMKYKEKTIILLEFGLRHTFLSSVVASNFKIDDLIQLKESFELFKTVYERKISIVDFIKGFQYIHYFIAYIISLIIVAVSHMENLKILITYVRDAFSLTSMS